MRQRRVMTEEDEVIKQEMRGLWRGIGGRM
jgi:hypothetical protein